MEAAAFTATVLGGLSIGAWLVIKDHPWFGLLVILIASSVRASKS